MGRHTGRPTFFWQGLLIVMPVLLLAGVGIVSLQKDRASVTLDARTTAGQYAKQLAAFLSAELQSELSDTYGLAVAASRREQGAPGTAVKAPAIKGGSNVHPAAFDDLILNWPKSSSWGELWSEMNLIDREGKLLVIGDHRGPGDHPRHPKFDPFPLDELEARTADLWTRARSLEVTDPEAAIQAYEEFLAAGPSEPLRSNAHYARALLLSATGSIDAALEALQQAASPSESTESGLSLETLAAFQRVRILTGELRRGNSSVRTELRAAVKTLCSGIGPRPSFATAPILRAAAEVLDGVDDDALRQVRVEQEMWITDEGTRAFHQTIEPLLRAGGVAARAFWTPWNGREWLVILSGEDRFLMQIYPEDIVRAAMERALLRNRVPSPAYAQPVVFIDDRRVTVAGPAGELLATAHGDFAVQESSVPGLAVTAFLANPDLLYLQHRQRAFWFGALIVIAAAAALAGYYSAHRAFRRQLHLNEMKSNFVSSVSHELRAPIASVRLMAEGLQRGTVRGSEKQHEYFRFIVQECRRLSALIENVLDFSRIDQGRKQYDFEPTDVVALATQTVRLMEPCAAERNVTLKLDAGGCGNHRNEALPSSPEESPSLGASITAEMDGQAIQQALVNLLDNAIKHSPSKAIVTIKVRQGDGKDCDAAVAMEKESLPETPAARLCLSVEDCGEGIPAPEHRRIFERFYRRGSELRRETQGVGIGLSIVKHIVEAHGGTVCVESEPGKGSRFVIELPVKQLPNPAMEGRREEDRL